MNLARNAIQMHHKCVTAMDNNAPSDRLVAEYRYQKLLDRQPEFVWREFGDREVLKTRIFFPPGHSLESSIPSVIFFHGGLWSSRNIVEFVPWAMHLACRGVASILPEYRTPSYYDIGSLDILREAREMWKWTYDNASELGLDGEKITVAGSDVGGLMALHICLPDMPSGSHWHWFKKTPELPFHPACVALFRGLSDTAVKLAERLMPDLDDEKRKALSPLRRVCRGLPPLFASHGGMDRLIEANLTTTLCKEWARKRNACHEALLDQADHSYYHFNVNARFFEYLLSEWDAFMVDHGIWLENNAVGNVLLD